MRLFVCLVSDTQVPTPWRALRIGLIDLVEAALIGIILGSSAPLQAASHVAGVSLWGCVGRTRAKQRTGWSGATQVLVSTAHGHKSDGEEEDE